MEIQCIDWIIKVHHYLKSVCVGGADGQTEFFGNKDGRINIESEL